MASDMIGAWVKIPGLGPDETGALHYLDVEQLDKLKDRVEKAISVAERKGRALEKIVPGTSVTLGRRYGSMPAGVHGYVADRELLESHDTQPDDYVPVCFSCFGLGWVPVTFLRF